MFTKRIDNMTTDFDSELVIGLVSAVGTETTLITELLKERLNLAGYNVISMKVSEEVIPTLCTVPDHGSCQFMRISNLMDAGNRAREASGKCEILALGAASMIFAKRDKENDQSKPSPKTAYIINSLKRPEEVAQLRRIYPHGFVLIGVHADESRRLVHLQTDRGMSEDQARSLIARDSDETNVVHGQRVNKTFHLADFFVRISSRPC